MSIRPAASAASATKRLIFSYSRTSATIGQACRPISRISAAVSSNVSCVRPHRATSAPFRANISETFLPIPRPPPVTSATLPFRSNCIEIPQSDARPSTGTGRDCGKFRMLSLSKHEGGCVYASAYRSARDSSTAFNVNATSSSVWASDT